ncbi:unnamed protein product [Closterium sp. NIES-65]|nr:unnamed protein product [Closterium sp. NIES-65]
MKRARTEKTTSAPIPPSFDSLPDELLTTILSIFAARASTPQDFLSCRLASTHLHRISLLPEILAMLPSPALACPAKNYTLDYRSFLSACAAAGNAEAAFFLGMVEFYCLERVASGMKRLVQAAKAGHAAALHSLSIIHFNGSGLPTSGADGSGAAEGGGVGEGDAGRWKLRGNRKVGMGMLLCVAAAKAGHPDALRELGLCVQDGFGIKRSVAQGRLLLVEANLRELANSGDTLAAAMGGASGSEVENCVAHCRHVSRSKVPLRLSTTSRLPTGTLPSRARLSTTSCRLPAASCRLSASTRLLPAAAGRLPPPSTPALPPPATPALPP